MYTYLCDVINNCVCCVVSVSTVENRLSLAELGVIPFMCRFLRCEESMQIKVYAASALANLALEDACRAEIIECSHMRGDVITPLLRMAFRSPASAPVSPQPRLLHSVCLFE